MSKVAISSFARVVNGATPSTGHPEYYDGDIVWVTPKDLSDQNGKYFSKGERTITQKGYESCSTEMIPAGNLLMSSRAPIGLLSINTVECCTNQGFKSLVIDSEKCDVEYLYYYLKYHIKEIEALGSGTTFKEVSKASMEKYEVDLPDIDIQKSIEKALSVLDKKIINNNKISVELEGLAKTIYDYWFLQFEFPNEDGKPYKSSGGKMVYSEELKREIPEGWDVKSLPECADLQYGYPLSVDLFGKEGNPVIRIRDILDNTISAYTSEQVSENYKTHEGDLLVGMDGNFQMNYWPENNDIVNQRITRIRKKDIPLLIVRNQIEPYILAKIESVARSTVGHLSDSDFKNQPILIPKNLNCNCFDNWLNAIIHFRKENKQLASLRDWLLPMLMNGQVAFKESL